MGKVFIGKTAVLLSLVALSACAPEVPEAPSAEPPPNVILIFADDLGYGDLSGYGHPTIHTPRLDRMAYEGAKLTAFYTAAPVCTPSRAALMTGRWPVRVGLPGNLGPDSEGGLSLDERTLADALRAQGYRTAAFGKWHLGSTEGYFPTDRGFDRYFGLPYSNDMIPPWVDTARPLHLYRDTTPTDEQPVDQTTLTRRYTEEAVRFIQESGGEPFFIYLPHSMPHLPVYASEEFQGRSDGGRYGDVIEELDWSVGRLLDVVAEEGLDENTLVIFTSDNGPWRNMPPRMYETVPVERWHAGTTGPLRGAKGTTYEGGARVPAVVRWSGRVPGEQVIGEIATTMDLHATILDLAGAAPPDAALDGEDLWAVLTEGAPSPHRYFPYFWISQLEAVRDATWKLRIAAPADDWISQELRTGDDPVELELFNLRDDPYEQFDVATEHPDVVDRLRAQMVAIADDTGATLAFTP
ncbi:MAG TPA: arylsulfatase [Acidobacteria bacterium]|jgi:arylsulfatase A-like enzyme|nr:sulfatase [Vicinamibacterales bacterium]HAK57304.1 arylsulfatase [Acidobacteriota bacterium]|tara:strand:- start:7413 stop:8813 length:1401 start_codon:yes stop_codon:yes gene_type:complete